jgi:hypothetical protein
VNSAGFFDDTFQVGSVLAVGHRFGDFNKLEKVEEATAERGFFGAADFDSGARFNGLDIGTGFVKGGAGAGVEPCKATGEFLDLKGATVEIFYVDGGDFKFTASGGLEVLGDGDHIVVIDVEAGHGVMAFWLGGFFLDGNGLAGRVELDDAVALGVMHVVAEDDGTFFEFPEGGGESIRAVEDVVAEDERHRVAADEGFCDEERLGDAFRFRLFPVLDGDSHAGTVAEELLEPRQVVRGGNEADVLDPAFDQRGQWMVNHRLVIDRLELLARDEGEWIETGACAACKNDAFHG